MVKEYCLLKILFGKGGGKWNVNLINWVWKSIYKIEQTLSDSLTQDIRRMYLGSKLGVWFHKKEHGAKYIDIFLEQFRLSTLTWEITIFLWSHRILHCNIFFTAVRQRKVLSKSSYERHYAEWKKQNSKSYTLWFHSCDILKKTKL